MIIDEFKIEVKRLRKVSSIASTCVLFLSMISLAVLTKNSFMVALFSSMASLMTLAISSIMLSKPIVIKYRELIENANSLEKIKIESTNSKFKIGLFIITFFIVYGLCLFITNGIYLTVCEPIFTFAVIGGILLFTNSEAYLPKDGVPDAHNIGIPTSPEDWQNDPSSSMKFMNPYNL